ncbi:GIY-YIG nuclease family protein [uncultured Sunxiuqinia sp.]|uniref:GIY-YIG nuclease family protein n=1 Tax=uncultured Sunxiuqinia sp. TaxID=1573825 RepID=UPI0026377D5A|nr:GIY-YIG nuclease family protein [uncultured Sunxiuqinia sp.]
MHKGFVYILSNKNRTTFYIGVTSDIKRRILEHKKRIGSAFTKKYNLTDLMYYEKIEGMNECINREKQLKNWHRDWKINLIRENNPKMKDLSSDWFLQQNGELLIADRAKAKAFFKKQNQNSRTDPEASSG